MAKIAHSVKQAGLHAANTTQKGMLDAYALSFGAGSIEAIKQSQRLWVTDQKPVLETNLGFVETYRDPHGVRGEWEGFVALVSCRSSIDPTLVELIHITGQSRADCSFREACK